MNTNLTNDELLTNLIQYQTMVVPDKYLIKQDECAHDTPTFSLFNKNSSGFKVIKKSGMPLQTILEQLMKFNNIDIHPEGFPILDSPGTTISLMKYFQGDIEMNSVLNIYENLLATGYISPVCVISILLICGFDLATLYSSKNIMNVNLWLRSLRGNTLRYKELSLAIGRLIIHHRFKFEMDNWSNDNAGYTTPNSARFNEKIAPILSNLEKILLDEKETILTYFADLLSIIRELLIQ